MEKTTLRNMPYGQLYEFGDGKYVWKIIRSNGTRNANYLSNNPEPTEYTEVFRKGNDDNLENIWSGRLTTNPGLYNEECLNSDGDFNIFSYDQDTSASFHMDNDLKPASLEFQIQAMQNEVDVLRYINESLNAEKSAHY